MSLCRFALCSIIALLGSPTSASAQISANATSSGITRVEGIDPDNHVSYVRLRLPGVIVPAPVLGSAEVPPALTAQCTRQESGRFAFEIFANFGGVIDMAYHRPWMPKDGGAPPPQKKKSAVVMDFIGYLKQKPVSRQWEHMEVPAGELRYNTPSLHSSNMEDMSYYLRVLRSLPTLQLSYEGKTVQFLTTPLLDALHQEPMCKASLI